MKIKERNKQTIDTKNEKKGHKRILTKNEN